MTTYSHSRLSTFEQCPLKYKFSYVEKIKRYVDSIEAFTGSRVHEVLEKLYKDLQMKKTSTVEELLEFYKQRWEEEWHDEVKINSEEYTAKNYFDKGAECIRNYYKRYKPFNQGITLGLEKRVSGSLSEDEQYRLQGYIDRLVQMPDGTYEIHDYKVSKNLPDQSHFDSDSQLALYHILIKKHWEDVQKVELVWHYMSFDKEMRSSRTEEQLEELIKEKKELIDRIEKAESENDFPAKESALCGWCDYPDLCPKKKHLVKVEALPENEYLKEDGISLVNTYAELDEAKSRARCRVKEIDIEMVKLKEAVIAYAKDKGYEMIRGTDRKLTIKFEERVKVPGKSEKERKELETIIQEIGKWDNVSTLDTHAFAKIVSEDGWPKDLMKKVEEFVEREQKTLVRLSKL